MFKSNKSNVLEFKRKNKDINGMEIIHGIINKKN